MSVDGVYWPGGILKIPDNCNAILVCNSKGVAHFEFHSLMFWPFKDKPQKFIKGTPATNADRLATFPAMKKTALLVTLAIALTAAAAGYYVWPRQETQFSLGFRRTAYSRLPYRSSAEAVRRVLGPPLAQRTFVAHDRWLYCLQEPQPIVTNPEVVVSDSEQHLSCPEIEFDQSRHVSAISGWPDGDASSLVGSDPIAVEARLGKPLLVRDGGRYTVWYYSGPAKTNARYEQFTVTLDRRGRVVDKNVIVITD